MRMLPFLTVLVGVAIIAGAYFWGTHTSAEPKHSTIEIRGQEIDVEVRDDTFGRARGLSGYETLDADKGMLFIFPKASDYGFWMKDMKFAIDIIWIADGKVVGFSENLQPEPEKSILTLTVYRPPQPVRYIVEVPAGTVQRKGFQVGDVVKL